MNRKLTLKLLAVSVLALPGSLWAAPDVVAKKDTAPPAHVWQPLEAASPLQESFNPAHVFAADIALAENSQTGSKTMTPKTSVSASVDPDKRVLKPMGKASVAEAPAVNTVKNQRLATPAKLVFGPWIGKDFVHNGSEVNCVMEAVADTNATMVHIHNFYGLEETVDAVVDLNAGTVSILPQRIWQSSQYGDVYLFPIKIEGDAIQYFPTTPVRGTIDANGVIRLQQWGAIVGYGDNKGTLLAAIDSCQYVPANATMTATKRTNGTDSQITYPLLVEQPSPSEMKIYNFGTTGVPVIARISPDASATVSEQFIANVGLYGAFHSFPIDPATGVINKDDPVTATISVSDSTMTFSPWCAGSIMQDGLVALYLTTCKFKANTALKVPDSAGFNLEGNGTAASPYLIKTAHDLLALSEASQKNSFPQRYFRLENDIDMSGVNGFLPIGCRKAAFNGNFNGNGHTISNLSINGVGYHFQGLFGAIYNDASVTNLTLANASITGSGYYLGLVAGYSQGKIINCHANGSVLTQGLCVGGIAGRSYGTIDNCSFSGTSSAYGYVGGIVGYSYGAITKCHSDADVSLPQRLTNGASCVGGIAGLAQSFSTAREGKMADCRFSGNVTQATGYGFAGGIAGYLYAVDMDRCLNTGFVHTLSTTGTEEASAGIAGIVRDSYIDDCHNAGLILNDGLSTYAGGIIGYITTSYAGGTGMTEPIYVRNCFNSGQIQAKNRTEHAGIFGDEFTMEQFPEKPSDTAFTNVFSDNQATGLHDSRFGRTSDVFIGNLIPGTSSAVWSAASNGYPTLKIFAELEEGATARAAVLFNAGESTRVMKHSAALQAPQAVKWMLLNENGNLSANSQGLSVNGNALNLKTVYSNDTLVATINGKPSGKRLIINVVPKVFDGEGTAQSPYLIKNKADFIALHNAIMHYDHEGDVFLQTADVDFGLGNDFSGVAAGNHLMEFAGTFDGGNHRIKNLKITSAIRNEQGQLLQGTYNYGGLFHIGTPSSIIRNIIIDSSCVFDFYGYAGAVIGYTKGKVEDCRNYAPILAGHDRIGGIVGHLEEGASVERCYNGADIKADNDYVGGIVGQNMGAVSECQNDGDITAAGKYIGGVAGASAGSLNLCVNSGTITGAEYVGGVIGSNSNGNGLGDITQCISSGLVISDATTIGGVAGYSNGRGNIVANFFDAAVNNMDGCSSLSQGFNSVATAELVTTIIPKGLDKDKFSFSSNAYPSLKAYAEESAGKARRAIYMLFAKGEKRTNVIRPIQLSSAQGIVWSLKGDSLFSVRNGSLMANIGNLNMAADTLNAVMTGGYTKSYPVKAIKAILAGSGSQDSPFLIKSHSDLSLLSNFMKESGMDYEGYFFRVENDIVYPDTAKFLPIAFTGAQFQGNFNGNGKKISAFSYVDEASKTGKYIGFFGILGSKANVHDLTLEGEIKGHSYTGGFAGKLYGKISHCVSRMRIDGKSGYPGGFAGQMYDGSLILGSTFEGAVCPSYATNYNYVGGFAGQSDLGSAIDSCVNKGTVGQYKNTSGTTWTGQQYIGGFVGNLAGTVSNSRNEGTINGRQQVGGIAGRLGKTGRITDCVNTADISVPNGGTVGGIAASTQGSGLSYIIRCVNTGNIRGKSYTAGIIGQISNGCTVDSCYNTGKISGFSSTAYGVGGVIGQMGSSTAYPSVTRNSWNNGEIYNEAQSTGGFAGKINSGEVYDCYNTGNVKVVKEKDDLTSSGVGGFAGSFCSTAKRIWNSGNVESNVPCAAGIFGTGAMPVAEVSQAVNYGNVTLSRTVSAKGFGAAGIWGGYGPVVIDECYNFGTITAPDDAAGINAAMHSNDRGGTTILRSFNAGQIVVNDTAKRYSNVAIISSFVDTRNPIDPSLMRVDSTYFYSTVLKPIPNDSLAVGLSGAKMHNAPLGENFIYRKACLPVLAFVDSTKLGDFYAADIEFHENDSAFSVNNPFFVGILPNVKWTASPGLQLYETGKVRNLKTGEHTLTVSTLDTENPLTRTYKVNVITLGIDNPADDAKEIETIEYYDLAGLRLAAPVPGQPCIARIRYLDGTTATRKLIITQP